MNIGKCKVDGCEKDAVTSGMCQMHYTRMYRHNDVHTVKKVDKYGNELCAISGCGKQSYAKFLCESHYDQAYRQKKRNKNS